MTLLPPAYKTKPPQWMQDPDLISVLDCLNHDNINAKMVGGCVRDFLFNKDVYDIDIACKLEIEETKKLLQKNNIRTIDTGIKHGTITAHINGKNFEITTLRKDTKTDGRHAIVEFTDNWTEDAKRRDFTINALYADRDGSIYDPLGTGLNDIQTKTVRFIGDAHERINEDYLRILRYFRFHAKYNNGDPNKNALNACKNLKEKIHQLSDERIYDELFKTLKNDSAPIAIKMMEQIDLFDLKPEAPDHLSRLIELQKQLNKIDFTTRYETSIKRKKYIKNKKQKQFIKKLNEFKKSWNNNIKLSLYTYQRDIVIQGLLSLKAEGNNISDITISNAISSPAPIFPVVASDIMEAFKIPQGKEVGEKLKQAEQIWIESDFTLPRNQILEKLRH